MTDQEKKAIEYFKENINYFQEQIKFIETVDCDYYDEEYELYKNRVKQFNTVLNLIQKQQAELKKKDKIIDLMTEKFGNLRIAYFKKEDGGEFMGNYTPYNKNDWKQYFEKKAEGRI